MTAVTLREVRDEDLPAFFALQADAASIAMAGVPTRDRAAFDQHWEKIRTNPEVILRTIECDGVLVGNAVSFLIDGHREIGYWLDRRWWGRGIATAALAELLIVETRRPLFGHILASNAASRRVLERNGFVYDSADDDGVLLILE